MTLVVAALAWGWWYMAAGRYPLAGDLSHDFGRVPITELTATVSHTFVLRNRTGRTIEIEAVRPGCGCTQAEPSTRRIEPDGTVELEVALTLSRAGAKRTHVALVLSDFGVQTLHVAGTGEKALSVSASTTSLRLPRAASMPLHLFADVQGSSGPPPAPVLRAPDGVAATAGVWTPLAEGDAKHEPRRWQMRVDVELVAESLPDRARLVIEVGREVPMTVALSEETRPPGS